jgi:7,8-dihydropterin-6-yl-methyl-4-(beta-D-ribofuranosyl)aminobenzene 5'-phosphate synthase
MGKCLFALIYTVSLLAAAAAGGTEVVRMVQLEKLSLHVIYDNTEPEEGFEAGWGFSCVVEGCGKTILFDTGGDGDVFMKNLSAAGFKPQDIDIVVISHEHWDHIGGLGSLLEENRGVKVCVPASFPEDIKEDIAGRCSALVEVGGPAEIIPGVSTTGEMRGPVREQSLVIATDSGTIVVTGCAHPGVDRIVERAAEVAGGKVLLVMGGFHLRGADRERLDEIAAVFDRYGVEYCGASHCTGNESIRYFAGRYGDRCLPLGAGKIVRGSDLAGR